MGALLTHVVYIPGLGDHYDGFRRWALAAWKRPDLTVTFVPMKWSDRNETYHEKQMRIAQCIEQKHRAHPTIRTVLIGESAGGAMAVAMSAERTDIAAVVTICGKNVRADRVGSSVYVRHPAFRYAMQAADRAARGLPRTVRYTVFYAPLDRVIFRIDSELPGAKLYRLPTAGHLFSIAIALTLLRRRIIEQALVY